MRHVTTLIDHLHYDAILAKPDGSCSRPAETGPSVAEMERKPAGGKETQRNAIEINKLTTMALAVVTEDVVPGASFNQ